MKEIIGLCEQHSWIKHGPGHITLKAALAYRDHLAKAEAAALAEFLGASGKSFSNPEG